MTFRLKQLTIENFRSIRGRATVDLDAPIVLIHGPNGVGKTSLLSAIELGLTGDVGALSRGENGFLQHLVHKGSPHGRGSVDLTVIRRRGEAHTSLQLSAAGIQGRGLLDGEESEFFSNRCYLAQSTLGRLFEIYQNQDARRSDTALTRFVKDLLRLDSLEALIDGLHAVGHVNRLRLPAPQFWMARSDLPTLERDAVTSEAETRTLEAELRTLEIDIRTLSGDVLAADRPIEPELLATQLSSRRQVDDRDLTDLERRRREIEVIGRQIADYAATDAGAKREAAEQALAVARSASLAWAADGGRQLETVIQMIQSAHAEIPPIGKGANAAHAAALASLTTEIARVEGAIARDAANEQTLTAVEEDIVAGQARIAEIDHELAGLAETNQDLASALASLAPHVHGDDCPVCGRDYGEVSEQPLAARLSANIAELTHTAGRLEALSRDRSAGAAAVAAALRQADEIRARRMTSEALTTVKRDLVQLAEWRNELTALADAARSGEVVRSALSLAERDLAHLNSQDTLLSGHRQQLAEHAAALLLAAPAIQDAADAVVAHLLEEILRRVGVITARQERLRRAEDMVRRISSRRAALESACTAAKTRRQRVETVSAAKKEADRKIDVAKDLVDKARKLRTNIVSRAFNTDLNTVWRELFIRLAPDEVFVPRFKLPDSSGGPIEAELETIYRAGGLGGDPRAMLSAGNLNTAALTLFLALHLSVPPTLPLLIIDDPVQSMDEVHIAQFAALLRTLKSADRQVVIAVHERALFDYLTLELSPAYNGDQLITIELTRVPGGESKPVWDLKSFKIDQAIAA